MPTGGLNSDWDNIFLNLASCAVVVFCLSFGCRWHVSPLCGIAHAKRTPKQMKISVSIENQQQFLNTQVSETHKHANM